MTPVPAVDRVELRRGFYYDSLSLMLLSHDVGQQPGVVTASAVAATPFNLDLLARQGFRPPPGAGRDDVVVAVRAQDLQTLRAAWESVERHLRGPAMTEEPAVGDVLRPRSVYSAAARHPGAGVLLVAVPGRHATVEVAAGIEAGLDVFCFSSGMPLDDEVLLKQRAADRGLLLMGPDCGTTIVGGAGLGFANAVRAGPVGVVGASGTGIQELTCLLDAAGVGVSHAIGVGGRDLSRAVGGSMTRQALRLLADDDATETIVVVSKPPEPAVAESVAATAAGSGKHAVLAFLGAGPPAPAGARDVEQVSSLEDAARLAAARHGGVLTRPALPQAAATSGFVRGFFCGGSLCYEAMSVAAASLSPLHSNVAGDGVLPVSDVWRSEGHTFLDFGDEVMTEGRLHPMVDPSVRDRRFATEVRDPAVGAAVLDVVLGWGAHPDPAGQLAPLIRDALGERADALTVVVSVCGTPDDPQGLDDQIRRLRSAGALVTRSARHAAEVAVTAATAPTGVPS